MDTPLPTNDISINETASARRENGRKLSARRIAALILAALFVILAAAALISTTADSTVTVSEYRVDTKAPGMEKLRIVLISDLHRQRFDEHNEQIVERAAEQAPDLICVLGDMLERDHTEEEDEELRYLFERLMAIAPVYFAAGNHDYSCYYEYVERLEMENVEGHGRTQTLELLESTGAVFLENDYCDVEIKGQKLRIGGFYSFAVRMEFDTDRSWQKRQEFLADFCDTDSFKLMLSHRPDSYLKNTDEDMWDIDLIVSGHTHNGVIAMPFGLGAIWTSEGFFPKHARGKSIIGSRAAMVVTGGLDGHNGIPRVFNPPEITSVEITGN